MKKMYFRPDMDVIVFSLTDVVMVSVTPINNPTINEVPILTRMKDDLAGGDGLSEIPTEVEE